ncbi:MAG: serine hydrolase, partial [Lachnospiraceae bacterium]|nr:serine hydrolase [Lachnospiraceae bacterium]
MKWSKNKKNLSVLFFSVLCGLLCAGCSSTPEFAMPYDRDTGVNAFRFETYATGEVAEPFAAHLAVVAGDETPGEEIAEGSDSYGAAVLFNTKNADTVYTRNAYASLYPASMTKVLTALVALENASPDTILSATENCIFTDNDVQKVGLKVGDRMTLDQALHLLLIYSANDVANLIAENVSESVEEFVDLMNERALKLGATNSHFTNPHGLQDENHYTTAYDMYLIFNEATKLEAFNQIINMSSYSTSWQDAEGESVTFSCDNTNKFIRGTINVPTNITVIGGKT